MVPLGPNPVAPTTSPSSSRRLDLRLQEGGARGLRGAAGRRAEPAPEASPSLTVNELLLAYWEFADGYYRKDGEASSEWHLMRTALRVPRRLYGHTPAAEFGPKALRACREELIARGLKRRSVSGAYRFR